MNWIAAFPADSVAPGSTKLAKHDGRRVVVARTDDGALHAIDDVCPHEGYPLAKGELSGCILTCKWHNFKFDVRDGSCVMGDEPVRSYPLRVRDGVIELDITDPPPKVAAARIWPSLSRGLLDNKMGQVARDVVRLLALGVTPLELVVFVCNFDAERAEWGTTHVLPVAVDVLAEAERRHANAPTDAALPLMQAFELAGESHARRPVREVAPPVDVGGDEGAVRTRFEVAVEEEHVAAAEGIVRAVVRAGWSASQIEQLFLDPLCRHFLDFGHRLIYQTKLFALIERIGVAAAEDMLASHTVGIVTATREDTLPEWRYFETAWQTFDSEALYRAARSGTETEPSDELAAALVDGARDQALTAMAGALAGGLSLSGAVDALSNAACQRLLRFDVAHDADITNQHDWLDVTHSLTYANALRTAAERFDDPRIVRALLFGARFVNVLAVLDAEPPPPSPEPVDYDTVWDAVLDDPATRPIVCAHLIKMAVATRAEASALGTDAPARALMRLMTSPIRERRLARVTHEAVRLIVENRVPKTLY